MATTNPTTWNHLLSLRTLAAVALCLTLAVAARADDEADKSKDKADAKADQAAIQGAWKVVGTEEDGQKNENPDEIVIRFEGEEVSQTKGGQQVDPATFKLDEKAKPKTLDLTPLQGPDKGKTIKGIYELTGDSLKICLAAPGGPGAADAPRPTEFKSGNGVIVASFEREAEADEKKD